MKKTWIGILLFLIAFNGMLAFVFLNKKARVEKAFHEMDGLPEVYEFADFSERTAQGLRHYLSKDEDNSLYLNLAHTSEKLSQAIDLLKLDYKGSEDSYFENQYPLPETQQDSLWQSFQNYSAAADKLVASLLPARKGYYQRYLKIADIAKQLDGPLTAERKKSMQASLDSATTFPDRGYQINIEDRKRLNNFLDYVKYKSNPVDEMIFNDLFAKMNELFPAKDKMKLYGKTISLRGMAAAERNQLYNYLTVLKGKADLQINTLLK